MKYKSCTDYWLDKDSCRFRGEFEAMYRDIDDPWGCLEKSGSAQQPYFLRNAFSGPVFCPGSGYRQRTGRFFRTDPQIQRRRHRRLRHFIHRRGQGLQTVSPIQFRCFNVLTDDIRTLGAFNLVILSELLWYILDDPAGVFQKIDAALEPGGRVGIHQYFPDDQKFGREVMPGLEGFESFLVRETPFAYEKKIVSYCDDGQVLLAVLHRKKG